MLEKGLKHTSRTVVLPDNFALAMGSGDLPEEVYAEATLVEVEGRKLTFSLVAKDSVDVIGEGTHIRYIVDRTKFLSKLKG